MAASENATLEKGDNQFEKNTPGFEIDGQEFHPIFRKRETGLEVNHTRIH